MKNLHALLRPAVPLLFVFSLTGCDHKELSLYQYPSVDIKVIYDWRNAPDAKPISMEAWFFPINNSDLKPQRYAFPGRDGGTIRLAPEYYHAIGLNGDNDDWARFRGTESMENFEIYTDEVTSLPTIGVRVRSIPLAEPAAGEKVVKTPEMFWNNPQRDIDLSKKDGSYEVTFYPEEGVCYYTVTILGVENMKYLPNGHIDGTLSAWRKVSIMAVILRLRFRPQCHSFFPILSE